MRNKIFTRIFLSLFLLSCEKQLKEVPKSIAVETFYNTPSEIESALFAIYAPIRNRNCMGGLYPAIQESSPDYAYGRGTQGPISEYQGLDNSNITRVGDMWRLFYQSIKNANLVIKNTPNAKDVREDQKSSYIGEARFMRGLIYFIMVRNWGGIPLRTEDNLSQINLARSSKDEVYKLISDDLTYAEQNLPDTPPLSGRPSKWVAKTVLADVYLYLGKWEEARDKSAEVISAMKYSLMEISSAGDFLKIFGPDATSTPEEIFSLKYSRESNQGWWYVLFLHHPQDGYHGAGGYFGLYTDSVKNSFIADWDYADLRRQFDFYNQDIGLGVSTLLCRKFSDPAAPSQDGAANDYPFYRYPELLLMYAEADNHVSNGPTDLAIEYVNRVRRRAYGKPSTIPSSIDYKKSDYDSNSFGELILKERGYETVYEGKRWLDLVRLGIAKDKILSGKGITVADKHLLWPIPTLETNYNKAIDPVKDQNPGY